MTMDRCGQSGLFGHSYEPPRQPEKIASVTPICQDSRSVPDESQPGNDGTAGGRRLVAIQESKLRTLPSHQQAVTALAEIQQLISAMISKHEIQDEAIQVWYDSAPKQTSTDRAYRSTEILSHDRDQALEAIVVYRRAAGVAQRAGDRDLVVEFEKQVVQYELDLATAEIGLSDLRQIIDFL